MLKYILIILILILFVKDWLLIQVGLLLIFFIFAVLCNHDFFVFNLGWGIRTDYLRFILILLRVWIMALIVISRVKVKFSLNFPMLFLITNLMLLFFLVLTFRSIDYLLFYITFEASLIPTLILILGWGYQPERIQAGVYLLFYTLFASLPLLASLLYIYKVYGSLIIRLPFQPVGARTLSFI